MRKYFVKHLCLIPPPYGGVTVYVKRLSLTLCKRDFLSGAFTNARGEGVPEQYKHLFENWFPKHLHSYWALVEMPKLLKVFSNYRIVHNHYGLNTAFSLWMIHKKLNIPAVWTIHSQMIDNELSDTNIIDRYCFKKLANDPKVQVVAVNEIEKQALIETGYLFKNEIKVIPAYVPPVEIGKPSDYLDEKLVHFLSDAKRTLLFYAESFATYNGQEIYGSATIIELFIKLKAIFPDLKLIFCLASLNGEDDKLLNLKEKISDYGLSGEVYWQIGAVSEMWPLHKLCTVYVRPTCTDGDSVMVREALALGLPVVSSDVTNRPEGCRVYRYGSIDDLFIQTREALTNIVQKGYPQTDYSDTMMGVYFFLLQ